MQSNCCTPGARGEETIRDKLRFYKGMGDLNEGYRVAYKYLACKDLLHRHSIMFDGNREAGLR